LNLMNPIVQLAASALPGEKKYILLAGAGVSKDAGIPTAWDLMLKTASLLYAVENETIDKTIDLEAWFTSSKFAHMQYSELIEKIYPHYPDQQDFLKNYLNNKEVGTAHLGIAEMVRRGIIRAIVTTNFDHYIEKALEEKGLEPQVISTDEDLKHSEPLIHCKAIRIYKPHGDLGHGALKNTPKDLEKLSPLMEEELIRVLSEHGVLVLGYSGIDKGIQGVLKKRSYNYYPLFWVNPVPPEGEIAEILKTKDFTYIPCKGAGDFINDYFKLLERLEDLAPFFGSGPTIADLRYNFISSKEPAAVLYAEYLNNILKRLEVIKPAFSKHAQYDDAIVDQITHGLSITSDFVEAALEASKYRNLEAIETLYDFFGNALKYCDIPDGFSGSYRRTDFDGYKFLLYEMFVCLIAALIKNSNWAIIGQVLRNDLFAEKKYEGGYVPFVRISSYVAALDEIRNNRLLLNRVSVMADIIRDRFTNSELAELIDHKEFMEADYFLFMRTTCHKKDDSEHYRDIWAPRSCIFIEKPPVYILKSESKRFLMQIARATGFENEEEFIGQFKKRHSIFGLFFRKAIFKDNPIDSYDLNKLGTRP
jgi:hypothetical protein